MPLIVESRGRGKWSEVTRKERWHPVVEPRQPARQSCSPGRAHRDGWKPSLVVRGWVTHLLSATTCLMLLGKAFSATSIEPKPDAKAIEFFEKDVRPLLIKH